MTHQNLYSGISKAAWGYFFLYFNLSINGISLLPSFVGFLLFLSALKLLQEEERELSLLRPLGILLALWHIAHWVFSWFGATPEGFLFLDLIVSLANLYFHFQLLTNLASIAAKHQQEGASHDRKLLNCRTVQTIMLTCMIVLGYLSDLLEDIWSVVSFCTALTYMIAGLIMIKTLLDFRKALQ